MSCEAFGFGDEEVWGPVREDDVTKVIGPELSSFEGYIYYVGRCLYTCISLEVRADELNTNQSRSRSAWSIAKSEPVVECPLMAISFEIPI